MATGLSLAALGLLLFERLRSTGTPCRRAPEMILLGFGAGMAFTPVTCRDEATSARRSRASLGVVNTAFMMGGDIGFP